MFYSGTVGSYFRLGRSSWMVNLEINQKALSLIKLIDVIHGQKSVCLEKNVCV